MSETMPINPEMSKPIPIEPQKSDTLSTHFQPRTWLIRATILTASLGLIHVLATPLYFDQWLGYGVFFILVSVLQVMYSMALAVGEPNRALLWAGIAGNTLLMALWAVTRTVGIPFFGPMAGEVLPVGLLDAVAQVLTVLLIVHLVALLSQFDRLSDRPLID